MGRTRLYREDAFLGQNRVVSSKWRLSRVTALAGALTWFSVMWLEMGWLGAVAALGLLAVVIVVGLALKRHHGW